MLVLLQGHYSAVTGLSLAPDGWTLISAGRDKVVHVWDLRKNTKLVTVPVYEALEGETWLLHLGIVVPWGYAMSCTSAHSHMLPA